jgi:hypothetical protein
MSKQDRLARIVGGTCTESVPNHAVVGRQEKHAIDLPLPAEPGPECRERNR